ncbi:MAG: hypothetical protein R3C56_27485 [Pirellulaceae bacterium]
MHDSLRYVGALTILVSPMLEILGGSWWHLLSLLVLCVCIVLASIGLRLRALMFTGSAFLLVDLVAMVIHSSFDHPQLLWDHRLGNRRRGHCPGRNLREPARAIVRSNSPDLRRACHLALAAPTVW